MSRVLADLLVLQIPLSGNQPRVMFYNREREEPSLFSEIVEHAGADRYQFH